MQGPCTSSLKKLECPHRILANTYREQALLPYNLSCSLRVSIGSVVLCSSEIGFADVLAGLRNVGSRSADLPTTGLFIILPAISVVLCKSFSEVKRLKASLKLSIRPELRSGGGGGGGGSGGGGSTRRSEE